jgi:RimJ/RimL family protein N-acetyltransferase
VEDAEKFIRSSLESDTGTLLFAIEISGAAAGSIGAHFQKDVYRKSAEIGYFLAEEYWGRGIMPAAISELTDYTFKNYDVIRLYARPYARNSASRRALEKAGFQLEGILKKSVYKNNRYEDSCMYALINSND